MPRGGARNRSGPQPDPASGRSERRGLVLTALPRGGYDGDVPEFPLPPVLRYRWEYEDKRRFQVVDSEASAAFRERELAVWASEWRSPQAAAWAAEPWRWSTVAEFCRVKTAVEADPDGSAALISQLHRFRDQIGLTPAGLRENGWKIAADELAEREAGRPSLKAVPDDGDDLREMLGAL